MACNKSMTDYKFIYSQFMMGRMEPFYKALYRRLLLYSANILGDRLSFLAEDCVQNAVLSIYMRRSEIVSIDQWRGWLITAVRNNSLMQLRSEQQRAKYEEYHIHTQEETEEIHLARIEQDVYTQLFTAIDSLPDKYRELFELSFSKGLKNAEIAQLLDIAEITVKKRKAKMLALIRQQLNLNIDETLLIILLNSASISILTH